MDSVALNSHYASRARPAPPRAPRRAFCTRACTSNCTPRRRNAPLESRMHISTSTGPTRPHHPERLPSAPPRADPGPLTTTPGEKGSVRAAGTWSAGPSVMVCPSRLLVCLKGLGADDPLHRRAPHGTTHLEGYSAGSWRRSPWTTCVPLDHGGPIVVLEGEMGVPGARARIGPAPGGPGPAARGTTYIDDIDPRGRALLGGGPLSARRPSSTESPGTHGSPRARPHARYRTA